MLPTGPVVNLILEVLIAGDKLDELSDRKKQVNHEAEYHVFREGSNGCKVCVKNSKIDLNLTISDVDLIKGLNVAAKRFFVLLLVLINMSAAHNGVLTRSRVSFPLRLLVKLGCYSNLQSARKGFLQALEILSSISISGRIEYSSKKVLVVEELATLFYNGRIDRSQCLVDLNTQIDWRFIFQFFTYIPKYYFLLSNRASDLLLYIFLLARQRNKNLKERGYFTISVLAIQQRLMLPSDHNNANPDRTIRQPIQNSVNEIMKLEAFNGFSLQLVYDSETSIRDFINSGFLRITMNANMFEKQTIELMDSEL